MKYKRSLLIFKVLFPIILLSVFLLIPNSAALGDYKDINRNVDDSDSAAAKECDELGEALFYASLKNHYQNNNNNGNFVVALDPGHGGGDPGACWGSLQEADLNWKAAMACKAELEQYLNVSVYITRGYNECPELNERVSRAINNGANIFVSLHMNKYTTDSHGVEAWIPYAGGYFAEDNLITGDIGNRLRSKISSTFGIPDRGNKSSTWGGRSYPNGDIGDYLGVIYYSRYNLLPGFLIEHAFIDGDYWLLSNPGNVDTLGVLDAQSIAEHYGLSKGPKPYVYKSEPGKLTFEWNEVKDATQYAFSTWDGSKYTILTEDLHTNRYELSNLVEGSKVDILVQAFVHGNWTSNDPKNILHTVMIPSPTNVNTADFGDGKIKLSWDSMPNMTSYAVWEIKDSGNILYKTELQDTSFIAEDLENEVDHTFLIQCKYKNQEWSAWGPGNFVIGKCSGPTKPTKYETSSTMSSISLSWNKVSGSKGYAVQLKQKDGSYKILERSWQDLSYTINNLDPNHLYGVAIQVDYGDHYSTFIEEEDLVQIKTQRDPLRPVITTNTADGYVKLSWQNIDVAKKYAVGMFINDNWNFFTTDWHDTVYEFKDLANGFEYTFAVQAFINGQWYKVSEDDYAYATPEGPIKPHDISFVEGYSSVELTWPRVHGTSYYAVWTRNNSEGLKLHTNTCATEHFIVNNLKVNTEYEILIQCKINDKWSEFDEKTDFIKVFTKSCTPKFNVEATGDGEVTVSWEKIEGATNYAVAECFGSERYHIYTSTWVEDKYIVSNLVNQKEHTFIIQANIGGSWTPFSESDFKSATPTGAIKPYNLSSAPSDNNIELSWYKVSGAKYYAVWIKTRSESFKLLTSSLTMNNYHISGLMQNTEYTLLVQVNLDGEWSHYDSTDYYTCSTIRTCPVAKAEPYAVGGVQVSWEAVPNAKNYAVAECFGGSQYHIFSTCITDTKYVVENLSCNKDHYFIVQAFVGGSWSSFTEEDFVHAKPNGPIKPDSVSADCYDTSIKLTWTIVPGAESYAVWVRDNESDFRLRTSDCKDATFLVNSLAVDTEYIFLIQVRLNGKWSDYDSSDFHSFATKSRCPKAKATATGDGEVTISWVPKEQKDILFAVSEIKPNGQVIRLTDSCYEKTFVAADLQNKTMHTFVVQCWLSDHWSDYNKDDYVSAMPDGPIKPNIFTHVSGYNTVTLSWNKVSGASCYAVWVSKDDGTYDLRTNSIDHNITSYTVNNIKGGIERKFLIQSNTGGIWSDYDDSDFYKATPLIDPTRPIPHVDTTGTGSVSISWNAISGASKYGVGALDSTGYLEFMDNTITPDKSSYTINNLIGGLYGIVVQAFVNGKWSDWDQCDEVYASVPGFNKTSIMSSPRTTIDQMVNYFNSKGHPYPSETYKDKLAPTIRDFCTLCYNEAYDEGVDPACLFCQAMHETGWLQFGGLVKPWQCNFGGLGATGEGQHGATFDNVMIGLRAQVQHLKCYASLDNLHKDCVDPRWQAVIDKWGRGSAPCLEDLNGKWAVPGTTYGQTIAKLIREMSGF